MKAQSALVTGGAGFIGSHIVEALLARGMTVWVLDDLTTGNMENLRLAVKDPNFRFIRGDIRESSTLEGLPEKIDVVFHEAAIASVPKSVEDPKGVHDVNVNGTIEVLELARRLDARRFVFASSAAVYGAVLSPPARETDLCVPGSPYGASKLAVENYLSAYHSTYGIETVALRYFNVYGPRQKLNDDYSGVIPLFVRQLLSSMTPTIYGDGLQTRDFVHVEDVARANMLAMESPGAAGKVFNVATGREVTILHLLDSVANAVGKNKVSPKFGNTRKGDLRVGSASIEEAREVLGYVPQVGFDDGIKSVVAYVSEVIGVGVPAS